MANAWVYPGGRLDEADTRPEVLSRIEGTTKLNIDSETRAAGLYLAAIRETFEDAGVLLARREGESEWLDLFSAPHFADDRVALHANQLSLSELAKRESLIFPIDELGYFAHWITPTFEPTRFDTFFFVARAPENQEPLHDAKETTDSFWIRPTNALDRFLAGELYLAPPTQRTLERLCAFDSVESTLAFTRDFVPPCIIPHLDTSGDVPLLLLPGDPDYPSLEEYQGATPVNGETRMRLRLP